MAHLLTNPREKIRYYWQAAAEAEQSAARALDADARKAYLAIMRTWIYLAEELEREIELGIAIEESPTDEPDEEIIVPRHEGIGARKSG